jgi:hypothetical protein
MLVLCAWCCREGLPGYLGEREPLDNPEATHGVCAQHKARLLESLPSRSFPEVQLLIVVHQHSTVLYEKLARLFAGISRVKVIVDRRVSDEFGPERARRIRKGKPSLLGGWTIVRFTPKSRVPSGPWLPRPLSTSIQGTAHPS